MISKKTPSEWHPCGNYHVLDSATKYNFYPIPFFARFICIPLRKDDIFQTGSSKGLPPNPSSPGGCSQDCCCQSREVRDWCLPSWIPGIHCERTVHNSGTEESLISSRSSGIFLAWSAAAISRDVPFILSVLNKNHQSTAFTVGRCSWLTQVEDPATFYSPQRHLKHSRKVNTNKLMPFILHIHDPMHFSNPSLMLETMLY